jgi:Bacteriophage tail sheath protein
MATAVSYPGVYIQEIPSGVRTIVGVATSIAAFVDNFSRGPTNQAAQIFSFADFERQFGGLDINSEASYGIQQFFLNGGNEAYVVRVTSATANNAAKSAAIAFRDGVGGSVVLTVTANSPGAWGNDLRIDIDYGTTDPTKLFNLTVTEVQTTNGQVQIVARESFLNLVIDSTQPNDAAAVVNAGSQLITLTSASAQANRPAQTGTASAPSPNLATLTTSATMDVSLNGTGIGTTGTLAAVPATYAAAAAALQGLIRGIMKGGQAVLPNATVTVVGSVSTTAYLVVKAGTGTPGDYLTFTDGGTGLASLLGLNAAARQNVQQYALGGTAIQAQALPSGGQMVGSDGSWDPSGDATGVASGLIGDPNAKTGIYALLDVDLFNLLSIPATTYLPDTNAAAVAADAIALCQTRRAFYLMDVPQGSSGRDTLTAIMNWLDANASLRSRNAAIYFPRPDLADPLNGFRLRASAPSGTMAGLYARIDATRGVWKAPAGTEASLAGVQKLEYKLTDPENGVLNPLAINCLRNFPVYGPVGWGARTLMGADQIADDYKYIPVRRLALFIEESLYRGTQWVVFEPNDEPLWAQIRLNVGAFMQNLFRQGAFQGQTPQDAYFVKCSKETTTQNDINLGIVNIIVGFAPLKPAEFVVIQIQQIAGQIAT